MFKRAINNNFLISRVLIIGPRGSLSVCKNDSSYFENLYDIPTNRPSIENHYISM